MPVRGRQTLCGVVCVVVGAELLLVYITSSVSLAGKWLVDSQAVEAVADPGLSS